MTIDTKITREHGYRMSLTVLISYIPLIPVFWFLVKPVLINAVSEAVASDIQRQVSTEVTPINNAFVALLQRDINKVRKEIAILKFKQSQLEHWTVNDAEYLADLEIELEALRKAMKALKK